MPQALQQTLDFLLDLRFNNYREWFEANRAAYERARAHVDDLVAEIITRFSPVEDLGKLTPNDCLYRIYRDIRFSKDKTPYKTHFGIVIGRGGRKATGRAYYLHIEPSDGSFIAAGIYDPSPEQIKIVRQAIADHPADFQSIINARSFKKLFGDIRGDRLTRPPKGFPPGHPALDLLKYKQFLATYPLTDADVLRDDFASTVVEVCAALKPFETYFHTVLGDIQE